MSKLDNKLLKFIELGRRFRKLNPDEDPEQTALESYTFLGLKKNLGWDEILKYRIVVILGEPGSGKTWEFRGHSKILQDRGEISFFVPLERLVSESVQEILSEEELKIFRIWLGIDAPATFFLDSVDEAKYRSTNDFLKALDRFRNDIPINKIPSIRLLISSRISEWRPQSDAHELMSRFQQPPKAKSKDSEPGGIQEQRDNNYDEILIVNIEPLDRSQVERFARELIDADPGLFTRALDERHAWVFSRRPIDVIDLLNYWNTYNDLGSFKDLIEYDVTQKLKETRKKQDPLTPEQASRGAEVLGAAVVFIQNFNFCVPDESHFGESPAIDSTACLPTNWLPTESYALLTRPLFDSASYGRIRFHHRRTAEYLASRWLAKLMDEGCTTPILEDLLFTRIRNQDILRPSLSSVAAWLCSGKEKWNSDIGDHVLMAAPWIHFNYGDPSQLSIEYRRKILKAIVRRYEQRKNVWIITEPESLSRLSHPDLAQDIIDIIIDPEVSEDVRSEIIRVVQYGRLAECLNAVLDIVADETVSDNLKVYSIACLRDMGEISHLERLWAIIKSFPRISSKLCACTCEALYPRAIGPEELSELLSKSDPVPEYSVDLPYYLRTHLEHVLTPEMSGDILNQLTTLSEKKPWIKKHEKELPVSANFYWLGEIIPLILKRLLEKNLLTEAENDSCVRSLIFLGRLRYNGINGIHISKVSEDFNVLTRKHPVVRRRLFWFVVEEQKRTGKKEFLNPMYLFSRYEIKPEPGDLDWSIEDINIVQNEADRLIATRMAINLWQISGRKWKDRRRVRSAISDSKNLLREFGKNAEYGPRLWLKQIWLSYFKHKYADKYWWQSKFYSARHRYWEILGHWRLLINLSKLKKGIAVGWLSYLAREADDRHSQWAPQSWGKLNEKYGKLITSAAKDGCKSSWRNFSPLLPHEKPNPMQTDPHVIVGLAGLQAGFMDGDLNFKLLSGDEARLATRYAVNELNGFPDWIPELAKYHPLSVQDVLSDCIIGEWKFSADKEHVHEVLSKLSWSGEDLIPLIFDRLTEQIRSSDPQNTKILETVLKVLLKREHSSAVLAKIVQNRINQYDKNSQAFMLWLTVWIQVDAGPALRYLQQTLLTVPNPGDLMINLCDRLQGGPRQQSISTYESYLDPIHLKTLVPLTYKYIPISHRVGGGRITASDDARMFRGRILEHLSQSKSTDADEILKGFLLDQALASHWDYIHHILDQRAERQADYTPWTPQELRTFAEEYETDPKTDRDLFKLAVRRLNEIKHDIEKADNSIRSEMHTDSDERSLRIWLSRKLLERSRKRYTAPQEEEIDHLERPDIRVERPGIPPISIEIKWADKWTLPDLLNGLETQLVGQYLRDDNSRHGIYVLGYIGRQKKWQSPDGLISFKEIVSVIEKRAAEIVSVRRDVENIAVISLIFTS